MTILVKLFKLLLNFIYLFLKIFPTRKQITLISRESNMITDDFRLLKDALQKELKDYQIVVLCKKIDNRFTYAFHMLRQMYHLSRSQVVILDTYCIAVSVLKHKKTLKVIQIWHALGLMKKAGFAILNKKEGRGQNESRLFDMHENYDYIFTSSVNCIPSMAQVFNYDEKYFRSVPLPRIDLLKDKNYKKRIVAEIFKTYPELNNHKINVLYAPTFRKNDEVIKDAIDDMCQYFDFQKYNLIIKLHPLSKITIEHSQVIFDQKFKSLDMLLISDYVISDYSSIIYEAGIINKKLLFYAFDLDDYKNNRDFFIDYYHDLPGPIVKNGKEINNFLKNGNYDDYRNKDLIARYVDLKIKNYAKNMAVEVHKIINNN